MSSFYVNQILTKGFSDEFARSMVGYKIDKDGKSTQEKLPMYLMSKEFITLLNVWGLVTFSGICSNQILLQDYSNDEEKSGRNCTASALDYLNIFNDVSTHRFIKLKLYIQILNELRGEFFKYNVVTWNSPTNEGTNFTSPQDGIKAKLLTKRDELIDSYKVSKEINNSEYSTQQQNDLVTHSTQFINNMNYDGLWLTNLFGGNLENAPSQDVNEQDEVIRTHGGFWYLLDAFNKCITVIQTRKLLVEVYVPETTSLLWGNYVQSVNTQNLIDTVEIATEKPLLTKTVEGTPDKFEKLPFNTSYIPDFSVVFFRGMQRKLLPELDDKFKEENPDFKRLKSRAWVEYNIVTASVGWNKWLLNDTYFNSVTGTNYDSAFEAPDVWFQTPKEFESAEIPVMLDGNTTNETDLKDENDTLPRIQIDFIDSFFLKSSVNIKSELPYY